jgi:hypothetical protein
MENKLPHNLKKPSTFNFDSYYIDKKTQTLYFLYSFDNGLKFTETITLGLKNINWRRVDATLLNKIVFNLHLILGIGYYKAYCPKKITIKSGVLSRAEAEFWNKLYTKGLGEFFYRNKLDFRGLINFPYKKNYESRSVSLKLSDRALLPWGGGKDSSAAAELLKELGHDFTLISLRDSAIQRETTRVAGVKRIINYSKNHI